MSTAVTVGGGADIASAPSSTCSRNLKTDTGRSALANCITLTPGTLTIDVSDNGIFYIHWINVLSVDEEEAASHVLRRFEWFIQRIFE